VNVAQCIFTAGGNFPQCIAAEWVWARFPSAPPARRAAAAPMGVVTHLEPTVPEFRRRPRNRYGVSEGQILRWMYAQPAGAWHSRVTIARGAACAIGTVRSQLERMVKNGLCDQIRKRGGSFSITARGCARARELEASA
jgi:hypothetical protein